MDQHARIQKRVRHVLDEIAAIRTALNGYSFEQYCDDYMAQRASLYALMVISEASRFVPTEYKEQYAFIQWHSIHDLGNRLRHEYHKISEQLIWDILQRNLPELEDVAQKIEAAMQQKESREQP
jgi:uncharacterized protein with HEPN domain